MASTNSKGLSKPPSRAELHMLQATFNVSRESLEQLQIYVDLLCEWQKKTNLVANSTLDEVWHRHICDSLQCKAVLPENKHWLDIGTGAGFPGLVLAICSKDTPNFSVDLVDSNGKKCAFLKKVIRETGAPAKVHCCRIESVSKQIPKCDVVTARALASLENLLAISAPWLESGATGLFMKGQNYRQELEICRGRWQFDLIKHPGQIEENSVLLEILNLRKSVS